MPYEKHTWQTGETITAEKLNNLENGVESNILIIDCIDDPDGWYLNKTYKQISNHIRNGGLAIFKFNSSNSVVYTLVVKSCGEDSDSSMYFILIGALTNTEQDLVFSTNNEDDYPFCRAG